MVAPSASSRQKRMRVKRASESPRYQREPTQDASTIGSPLPAHSPLWAEPKMILTAHLFGHTPRSFERYQRLLLDNLGRWVRGQALLNVVAKQLGY